MSSVSKAGNYLLGDRLVNRMGYGAMQLAGPNAFGPPKDSTAAIAVLREALASGVNHIDTSDYYGPYLTNRLIREALHPYAEDLTIVTKVGAVRGSDGSWNPALSPAELTQAVHDNLLNLKLDVLDVVNFRAWGNNLSPSEESIEESFTTLAELQAQGLIRHLGVSNVTASQIKQAQGIANIVCVQNHYNLSHRTDETLISELGQQGIAYVPFFPLGGFTPLQSQVLSNVATRMEASPLCVALAWLLQRAPNILLIPGTSSVAHLRENFTASELVITPDMLAELEALG
ncbi:aldo/keto reductase family oxidoreductase [Pseudomonas nunensis]|uniref:aldo/keto reductase family oxidoreductase n=1 Tax=Pseudomonas nunensis TaxID=2961896 RepID=UPI0025AF6A74|nr:aldo/keto reductase family oxidoreductase [Pseudomonas nunensis]MDN3219671.1 aldo/keto reductase family oxidoreductase [Pseudomonas nunensis]